MSPRCRLILLLAVSTLIALPGSPRAQEPTTQAAASAAETDEHLRSPEVFALEQREALAQLKGLQPRTPPQRIESLLKFDVVEGHLRVTSLTPAPAELNFELERDGSAAFHMSVNRLNTQPPMDVLSAHVMRYDAAAQQAINVDVQPAPGHMNMSVTIETPAGTTVAQLIEQMPRFGNDENPPVARLYMSRQDTPGSLGDAGRKVAEPNFATLVEQHHDAALAMLGEGLTALRGMHVLAGVGQAEARDVFAANRSVDAATAAKLDEILLALATGGRDAIPEQRTRLRELGPAAALALHARPREKWSVDLSMNVDTLTADLMPGRVERSDALLASPDRLIDLLYSPDIAVRRGALERLGVLRGEMPKIDPAADPYANPAAIESLRRNGPPTTRPH